MIQQSSEKYYIVQHLSQSITTTCYHSDRFVPGHPVQENLKQREPGKKEKQESMPYHATRKEFERLVAKALASLPVEFQEHLENVVIRIVDEPPGDMADTMGYYEGVPLVERSLDDILMPDCITVFKGPIERVCGSHAEIEAEITVTVLHEIGHAFGLDERQLEQLERRLLRGKN